MSDDVRIGSCLCGAVKYEATLTSPDVHVCHCGLCRKWDGGPALSVCCEEGWSIDGEDKLKWYDSSEWAQRGFCSECGTHLFFRTKDGSYHGITAGALDDREGLKIASHIFIDRKPPYYDFKDDAKRLTEAEFLEMVGATPPDEEKEAS